MNRGEVLAIAGVVIGVVVTIAAAWKWGTRRRRLLFTWRSTPLLPVEGSGARLVQVTYRDLPVDDPHLVAVTLRNVGPSDIATQHFDAGQPIVVDLGCRRFYGATRSTHPEATLMPAVGREGGWIQFRPLLLRRGEEFTVEAVVEGDVAPTLTDHLIDTDVVIGWAPVRDSRGVSATVGSENLEAAPPPDPRAEGRQVSGGSDG